MRKWGKRTKSMIWPTPDPYENEMSNMTYAKSEKRKIPFVLIGKHGWRRAERENCPKSSCCVWFAGNSEHSPLYRLIICLPVCLFIRFCWCSALCCCCIISIPLSIYASPFYTWISTLCNGFGGQVVWLLFVCLVLIGVFLRLVRAWFNGLIFVVVVV